MYSDAAMSQRGLNVIINLTGEEHAAKYIALIVHYVTHLLPTSGRTFTVTMRHNKKSYFIYILHSMPLTI